ncbi:alpha/beta fold hydrolase [Paenibacillus chitinolyticus]|uniref:alpha/beta fold hydrolase n=1 Tax=Paenibacillus chitinolyticus TaxID=79263 RepID=UPI00364C9B85
MNTAAEILRPKKKAKWKIVLLIVLSLIVLTVGSGFVYEWIASEQAKRNFPPPGKLVDVGGYRLHIHKIGAGSPTILLEAGSGDTSLSWKNIPKQLAEFATVVSYDRAGYAWSEKANTERTGANIVREFHTALEKEGIGGPYIVVGHSLGGKYARLFAQTYRDEVSGLVLVDARPEIDERDKKFIDEQEKLQGDPPASLLKLLKMTGGIRLFKGFLLDGLIAKEDQDQFINVIAQPSFFDAREEEMNLQQTTDDVIRGQNLGSLPVKIITHGVVPPERNKQVEEIWQAGQRNMLNISTDSQLIVAKKSGHYVFYDEPELVVNAIRSVFDKVSATAGGR